MVILVNISLYLVSSMKQLPTNGVPKLIPEELTVWRIRIEREETTTLGAVNEAL